MEYGLFYEISIILSVKILKKFREFFLRHISIFFAISILDFTGSQNSWRICVPISFGDYSRCKNFSENFKVDLFAIC